MVFSLSGFDKDLHGATGAGSRLFAHVRRDLSRYEDGERLGHPAGSCSLLLLVMLSFPITDYRLFSVGKGRETRHN